MIVALGSDHGGFPLRKPVVDAISSSGRQLLDLGTFDKTPVDYPDVAKAVAEAVVSGQAMRGILICGSGVGASIAANKIAGVRAGLCHDTYSAHQGVEHDDMNILCLGARVIGAALAGEVVNTFLDARFNGIERYRLRLEKISSMEKVHRHE